MLAAVIIAMGAFGAPLIRGATGLVFWAGVVAVGLLIPLALNQFGSRLRQPHMGLATLTALLILLGGALLRITLVVAGQM